MLEHHIEEWSEVGLCSVSLLPFSELFVLRLWVLQHYVFWKADCGILKAHIFFLRGDRGQHQSRLSIVGAFLDKMDRKDYVLPGVLKMNQWEIA